MEKVRKISKKYYLRQIVACWLMCWMVFGSSIAGAITPPPPGALPEGWEVVTGSVGDFDYGTINELHIRNIANGTIIKWNEGFNIGSAAWTEFQLINEGQNVLNQDVTGNLSQIYGTLTANGGVFIVNPAGIVFGGGAVINVPQLVASSLNLDNDDFLNGAPYEFTGGAVAGDVVNRATNITAERLYLIGRRVGNRGILAADDCIIMAAGETVLISENSPVVVEVSMPEQTPGSYDYIVDNSWGPIDCGDGDVEADHVILAAGDIWSAAIDNVETVRIDAKGNVVLDGPIYASAEAASDAVADVTIITGGDFTVEENEIIAEAVGDGDNAFASITINADGDVSVLGDGVVKAEAEDGVLNEANVDITGKNILVKGDGSGSDDAFVKAYAHDGEENTANITMTANGEEDNGNVIVEATGKRDEALIFAKAWDGITNTATVDIEASGDVRVTAVKDSAAIKALAKNDVEIHYDGESPDPVEGLTNTATIDITATNVEIAGEAGDDDATVEAVAENVIRILADEGDAFALTVQNLINIAGVTINATEDVTVKGGRSVIPDEVVEEQFYGDAEISAEAGNVMVIGEWRLCGPDYEDFALDLTMEGLENDADVDITAANVDVTADGAWRFIIFSDESEAEVQAKAYNELGFGWFVDEVDLFVHADNITNNADIQITTTGNTAVTALRGGAASVNTEAYNEMDESCDNTIILTADNFANNAGVDIDAGGDVLVTAECEGDCSEVTIIADAWNDIPKPENEPEIITNDASVNITATNVEVTGTDCGEASIGAYAALGTDDTASVVIDASGNVRVASEDGEAYIEAIAEAGDATATVDIDADGDVTVENAEVTADARTKYDSGDADATVDISAGGNVSIVQGLADTVKAFAMTEDGSGDADASMNISAGGSVTIDDNVKAIAHAFDPKEDSGDATATIDIDAGTDVTITDDVEAVAVTKYGAGDSDATIEITAGGDVTVKNGTDVEAKAKSEKGSGTAAATVAVVAANLTVTNGGKIKADAEADRGSGDADADVGITLLESDVLVKNGGSILASADTSRGSGDATADVTITGAENVTVINGGGIAAYADAEKGSGDAEATVDIDATGDVLVEHGGEIVADAETYKRSGDATATVDIDTSGNVTVGARGNIMATTEVDNFGGPDGSSSSATSLVEIDAVDVIVEERGEIEADADVDEDDSRDIETFIGFADADVDITATGVVIVDGLVKAEADLWNNDNYEGGCELKNFPGDTYEGSSYANVTIDNILGLGVTVGPDGEIIADSELINWDHPDSRYEDNVYSGEAVAGIDIQTCGDVIVDGLVRSVANIDTRDQVPTNDDYLQTTTADVIIKAFGDVIVNSEHEEENGVLEVIQVNGNGGSNGQIEAVASNGEENSAVITVLAAGDVIVNNGSDTGHPRPFLNSREEIRAAAFNGSTNNADVRIATREGFGGDLIVSGQIGARTWIEGEGGSEHTNTSNVEICVDRDVIVNGGYAKFGVSDNPGTILLESHEGGQITAAAQGGGQKIERGESLVSFNNANVDIFAGRDVIVHGAELEYTELIPNGGYLTQGNGCGFYDGGQIIALIMPTHRNNYNENTSTVGIYAQRDVTIGATTITGEPLENGVSNNTDGLVLAGAHGNDSINTAEIEICAQDDVTIDGVVEAKAGTGAGLESEHYAHIRIAAGDLLGGTGSIIADADPAAAIVDASVTFFVTGLANLVFDGDAYSTTDHGATKVDPDIEIGPVDCPECDFGWIDWLWCVDCEERPSEAAPLPLLQLPVIEGCPAETQAAAGELGITAETIQVSIANALALNPDIHPCQACARLINAARILSDEDGSLMAATVQTFNTLAPADAPFTPEMGASIAMTFEAAAAEGSQFASVAEYIDAFVEYVTVLETGLGAPVGNSTAFAMEKYGAGIASNANIAAYVEARLAGL